MGYEFKWDEIKAAENEKNHKVTFGEAATVFDDPLSITIYDAVHSRPDEDRFITLGCSARNRLLTVVHMYREERVRIISCWKATRRERKSYEQGR